MCAGYPETFLGIEPSPSPVKPAWALPGGGGGSSGGGGGSSGGGDGDGGNPVAWW